MRRFKQQLSEEETVKILSSATSGALSLCGEDSMPYGVPLSHVYANGKLYFHSAPNGHKVNLIKQNGNASFTVIAQDEVHPETYTTYFQSVIAFGRVRIVDDPAEKRHILEILGRRCNPSDEESLNKEINSGINRCLALEMTIDSMTGKQAIELTRRPQP